MNARTVTRLALALLFGLTTGAAVLAQTAAPAAAPGAGVPTAAGLVFPNNNAPGGPPPVFTDEKLREILKDPKVLEYYSTMGRKVTSFCANCHGPGGASVKPEVPNLAGQNTAYVLQQLTKFTEGKRKQFFMEGLMRKLTPEEKFAAALYYTSQKPVSKPVEDEALAARGKQVYDKSCFKCHGEKGYGDEKYARLAGQQPDYVTNQVKRYRDGSAARSDEKMMRQTRSLTDDDVKALVVYIGSMK